MQVTRNDITLLLQVYIVHESLFKCSWVCIIRLRLTVRVFELTQYGHRRAHGDCAICSGSSTGDIALSRPSENDCQCPFLIYVTSIEDLPVPKILNIRNGHFPFIQARSNHFIDVCGQPPEVGYEEGIVLG